MKLICLINLWCLLVFISCGSDDAPIENNPNNSPDVSINVSPETLAFSYTGGNQSMTVNSDVEWGVSSSEAWCKVSPSGGVKGSTVMKVTVEKNTTDVQRSAFLTIKSGEYSRQYTITQSYDIKEVIFADKAFETYCVSAFDTDKDGKVSEKEALAVTAIEASNMGITSLDGLERFINLTDLNCKGNKIQTLDISVLKNLVSLNCADNQLSELDIRMNVQLKVLDCTGNPDLKQILVWTGFEETSDFKKPESTLYEEPEIPTPMGYELVWHDEFNTSGDDMLPDTDNWYYETAEPGWVNNELQTYIAGKKGDIQTAEVSYGTLKIRAIKDGDRVYSARLNSRGGNGRNGKGWKYGYFEASLKLPKGKGTWPAYWMMPVASSNWPDCGEIDIMEEVGCVPNEVSSSIHCKAYYHAINTQKTAKKTLNGAQTEFHIYALEWDETEIKTYVDGVLLFRYKPEDYGPRNAQTWPFDKEFELKLNLAWGGDWGGMMGVDESCLPATYEIDYVRVFQKK